MANDEMGSKEESGYDKNIDFAEIDKEVGPGDIRKEADDIDVDLDETPKDGDHKVKYLKKGLFVLLLAVVGFTVLGVSYKIGEKIFFAYKPKVEDSSEKNVTQNRNETTDAAIIVPSAGKPSEGGVKSGVKESVPVKIVKPASDQIERVNNTAMLEKKMIQPAQKS